METGVCHPEYIYNYVKRTRKLSRLSLSSDKRTIFRAIRFSAGGCLTPISKNLIIWTGGGVGASRKAVQLDTDRECAAIKLTSMVSGRSFHAAIRHTDYIYVIGGLNNRPLQNCERLNLTYMTWEEISPLPLQCCHTSVIEQRGYLYALGGRSELNELTDLVQRLHFPSNSWSILAVKLPNPGSNLPVFKVDEAQICFILNTKLYTLKVQCETLDLVKEIRGSYNSTCGPSYFKDGFLYCSTISSPGSRQKLEVPSLPASI